MNRAFKIQFHDGYEDEKTIVLMSVAVLNGKRFSALNKKGKQSLVNCLKRFMKQVESFTEEIESNINTQKTKQ